MTIVDIAKESGYSVTTVSRVLNNRQDVSPAAKETIMKIVGFEGNLVFDSTKPDGTPRKLLDVSKINTLGWKHQTSLEEGIQKTLNWIQKNNFEMFV